MDSNNLSLAIDLGNSTTNMGLLKGDELVTTYTVATHSNLTVDEAWIVSTSFLRLASNVPFNGAGDDRTIVTDAIVSSVVPDLTDSWIQALNRLTDCFPLVVGPGLKTGIKMHYKDPGELGSDRIADLVAAFKLYKSPFIVVDLGTTTNLEVVDEDGYFVGGIIAPGLNLAAKALADAAARLPVVDLKAPASLLGKSSREAMQAGVVMGEVARIDGLIDMVWDELGYRTEVIATGDHAAMIAALSQRINHIEDNLTLRGLGTLLVLNRR